MFESHDMRSLKLVEHMGSLGAYETNMKARVCEKKTIRVALKCESA